MICSLIAKFSNPLTWKICVRWRRIWVVMLNVAFLTTGKIFEPQGAFESLNAQLVIVSIICVFFHKKNLDIFVAFYLISLRKSSSEKSNVTVGLELQFAWSCTSLRWLDQKSFYFKCYEIFRHKAPGGFIINRSIADEEYTVSPDFK